MSLESVVKGRRYAVLGLGVSGGATALALHNAGAEVFAWDDVNRPDDVPFAITNLTELDWNTIDALVMSPGIPHSFPEPHPVAAMAKSAGVPLISDVELLVLSRPKHQFAALTGTNGKSTTTALLAHIVETAGISLAVGGNLGPAALSLNDPGEGGWHVLELSSYQCELLSKARFDVAGFLNLTPDHLDRHGGMEGYAAAKFSLFNRVKAEGSAIICTDDRWGEQLVEQCDAPKVIASTQGFGDVTCVDGKLIASGRAMLDAKTVERLPGQHNWQNIAVATAMALKMGIAAKDIVAGIESFPGLAHRQELVGKAGNLRFINDSKATNAEAVLPALKAYRQIHWLLGGQAKDGGIQSLGNDLNHVESAYVFGDAADLIAGQLEALGINHSRHQTLDQAFDAATITASASDQEAAILLSPACASWDQFSSFEARGDHFRFLADQFISNQ